MQVYQTIHMYMYTRIIPVLIEAMNSTEEKVVAGNAAILTPHCLCCRLSHINVLCTVHRRTTMYMYVQCIIVTAMFVAYVYLTNMEE